MPSPATRPETIAERERAYDRYRVALRRVDEVTRKAIDDYIGAVETAHRQIDREIAELRCLLDERLPAPTRGPELTVLSGGEEDA